MATISDFHKKILFSNKANFWLNGYVSKEKIILKKSLFGVLYG